MLEAILTWDKQLFLFLNGINHPFVDSIMLFISYSLIPAFLILIFILLYGYTKYQKAVTFVLLGCLITFGLSDLISTRVFKDNFKRLRPCHESSLKEITYTAGQKCGGGKFGFVSSHASNTMSIAIFTFLVFYTYTKATWLLVIWSFIVSYSRIYLGRHYPLDLVFGWIIGIVIALVVYKLFQAISSRFPKINNNLGTNDTDTLKL